MSKLRVWYVATCEQRLIPVGPAFSQLTTDSTRVETVEAINRREAESIAALKWPGEQLAITRGSQG